MRRTLRKRQLELLGNAVERHDRVGACEPEPRDDLQADASASDNRRRVARLYLGGVTNRAHPRYDATPEESGLPERKLSRDWDGAASRDHREVGEAGSAKPVLQRRPVRQVKPARAVEQRAACARFGYDEAEIRLSCEAVAA